MVELRPMQPGDVEAAVTVWQDAAASGRAAAGLPPQVHDDASFARDVGRVRHLQFVDPEGAWVAEDRSSGSLVGMAVALLREGFWVLSLLGVAPSRQSAGVGRRLLERALAYGDSCHGGIIVSSRDARAIRSYANAGFTLHPAVTAWGHVRHQPLPGRDGVREGRPADIGMTQEVDRRVRGAGHGVDLAQLLDSGDDLLVCDDGGYAVARGGTPVLLASVDEAIATRLLRAVLARAQEGEHVEVKWLTAAQQWAVRVALDAGLELHPVGPVMLRGRDEAPHPYLPNGSYG